MASLYSRTSLHAATATRHSIELRPRHFFEDDQLLSTHSPVTSEHTVHVSVAFVPTPA